jgi:hypothetical protein
VDWQTAEPQLVRPGRNPEYLVDVSLDSNPSEDWEIEFMAAASQVAREARGTQAIASIAAGKITAHSFAENELDAVRAMISTVVEKANNGLVRLLQTREESRRAGVLASERAEARLAEIRTELRRVE